MYRSSYSTITEYTKRKVIHFTGGPKNQEFPHALLFSIYCNTGKTIKTKKEEENSSVWVYKAWARCPEAWSICPSSYVQAQNICIHKIELLPKKNLLQWKMSLLLKFRNISFWTRCFELWWFQSLAMHSSVIIRTA